MARRHLSLEEQQLWTTLTRSVRPMRAKADVVATTPEPARPVMPTRLTSFPSAPTVAPLPRTPAAVLDSGWERRIRSGSIAPEMSIDLHGHSLSAAHARLNQALSAALVRDIRVVLVVTGKPPKSSAGGESSRRGAIRKEIGQWLVAGTYADRIASVRVAHPRHGGDGALYVIMRRKK